MSSSSSSLAQIIFTTARFYTISVYLMILGLGLIGNFCNILVFSCFKVFRGNKCAYYLIVESISSFILLILVLPFRISTISFGYDPTQLSSVWCKLRPAAVGLSVTLSLSAICFVAIDQYLSTNSRVYLRQLSTLKLAQRLISIAIIVLILYHIPFLILFEIKPESGCVINNLFFAYFYSFVNICIIAAILPITVSAFFATLAYRNVRRIIRRQIAIMRRRLDRQLTAMVLAKVTFFIITTLPFVISRLYSLNISTPQNDAVRIAIEQLVSAITSSFFYINNAGTFYVFIFVSKRYRQQVKHVFIKTICKKLSFITNSNSTINHNQTVPISNDIDLE